MTKRGSILIGKQNIIKALVAVVLVAIVINQLLWLQSMSNLHQREFEDRVIQSANDAVWMELSERREEIGGFIYIGLSNSDYKDSLRYINKEVKTADSIYNVVIDRQDVHSNEKIIQLVLKSFLPINLVKLDSMFNVLVSSGFALEDSYFDYIDLRIGELIETNRTSANVGGKYFTTDTIPLDISDSIGVIGYASFPRNTMLHKMLWQLILSAVLIIIAILGVIYISKSFVWQWRTEKMRQESIYAMTHEFKRPISVAMAGASLISYYIERDNAIKASSYAHTIEKELTKLTQYIDSIKLLSNSDDKSITLSKADVDINSFLNSVVSHFNSTEDGAQKVQVNLDIKTTKEKMYVDQLHLSNVIENLIENAIKYNVNSSVVVNIVVYNYDNKMIISVEDNGIGISDDNKKLIFERYYREKRNETDHTLGFGLGLTYTKSIVEAHGGNISVSSTINEGSKFVIAI